SPGEHAANVGKDPNRQRKLSCSDTVLTGGDDAIDATLLRAMDNARRESSPTAVVLLDDLAAGVFQKKKGVKGLADVFDLIGFALFHRDGEHLEGLLFLVAFVGRLLDGAVVMSLSPREFQTMHSM